MLDGTPILDIKPYLSSIPAEELRRGWLAEAEARKKARLVQGAPMIPHHPPLRLRSGQALFAKCAKRMGQPALFTSWYWYPPPPGLLES